MCNLSKTYDKKEFIGYKVVADKDGYFFSPAMGCKYPLKGKVPVIRKQKRLSDYFFDNILDCPRRFMPGRTAAFFRKEGAESLANCINNYARAGLSHKARIVKVKLTGELKSGEYCVVDCYYCVVAGKYIEFLNKPRSKRKD